MITNGETLMKYFEFELNLSYKSLIGLYPPYAKYMIKLVKGVNNRNTITKFKQWEKLLAKILLACNKYRSGFSNSSSKMA